MTDTTRNGFTEIEAMIEKEKTGQPKVFPYTTRELAEMFGMSNSTVWNFLRSKGLITKGHFWIYQHNKGKSDE